ncbi:MAG: hypothetical protein KTR32_44020 [Granulosicoccus sp.]|nr:hypothetical protein [Granulosicoccus sp.]
MLDNLIKNWSELSATSIVVYAVFYGFLRLAHDILDFLKKAGSLRRQIELIRRESCLIYLPTKKEVKKYGARRILLLPLIISVPVSIWSTGIAGGKSTTSNQTASIFSASDASERSIQKNPSKDVISGVHQLISGLEFQGYPAHEIGRIAEMVEYSEYRIFNEIEFLRNLSVFLEIEMKNSTESDLDYISSDIRKNALL